VETGSLVETPTRSVDSIGFNQVDQASLYYNNRILISQKKAEVSKRQYSSKAKGSNTRDFLPVIGIVQL
jgi:hypothetical protein